MKIKNQEKSPSKINRKKIWKNVKLKGNVISEDGIGLEGLIGLEVLKSYDPSLLTDGKKHLMTYKEKREAKKLERAGKKLKAKSSNRDSEAENSATRISKPPKVKKKPKQKIRQKNESESGKFVLLKPPLDMEEEMDETELEKLAEDEKNATKLLIDELEGWNGLGVPEVILRALAENKFKSPTQIQQLTLPAAIMGKKDIIGAAETGSGKTLAFGIPMLAGIMELKNRNSKTGIRKGNKKKNLSNNDRDNCTPPPEELNGFPDDMLIDKESGSEDEEYSGIDKPLYAVVLTPTRELAVQVRDHIIAVAKYTGIQVVAVFGGLALSKQERILKKCPEIVVATPGRFWELLDKGNSHLNKIDDISFLVIDETDRMIEKGHFEELQLLLKRLNSDDGNKESRQNFVFSATLALVHDLPDHLKKKNIGKKKKLTKQTSEIKIQNIIEELGISQPKIVDITNSNQTATNLTESRVICGLEEKDYFLYYFLQKHPGRTIVFCNSIDCVKRLGQLFGYLNCKPLPLHAQMIQKQRLRNLERFRDNPNGFLVATDVAARGLDIPNVHHVVHYQVPRTSENYVHRSGRTARANKDGITIMLMEPTEVKTYLKLCKTLDKTKDLPLFPVSDRHMRAVKERVNLAREIDLMELKLSRKSSEEGWFKKNADEMEIMLDDSDGNSSSDDEVAMEKSKQKRYLFNKRQTLATHLTKPLFPKGFSYKYPTSSGKLELPFNDSNIATEDNSAVKAMKDAIDEMNTAKKQRNKRKHS